jgi:hypothetical protein
VRPVDSGRLRRQTRTTSGDPRTGSPQHSRRGVSKANSWSPPPRSADHPPRPGAARGVDGRTA